MPVSGKTGNSVAFGTDGDCLMVTATQCTECNTVRDSSEQLSSEHRPECKLQTVNAKRTSAKLR